ncbi:hypothetical protein LJC03_01640 [Methanobrevibacter sp. OttesenSCG-928-I08]|nr:hypothetical protein [Methanobrevibacter sp. OttesenSCG-928-I08]
MVTYTDEGTIIKGNRIVAEARKLSKPKVINKTGRHKSIKIVLTDNAECTIIKKLKFLK